jgi:hypothetical protein
MTWTISTPRDAWIARAKAAWVALEPQDPTGAQMRALAAIDGDARPGRHGRRRRRGLVGGTPHAGS